jgi:hypothetical protein
VAVASSPLEEHDAMSPAASNTDEALGEVTDTTLVPLLPSLVAVMVAEPTPTPVTSPELLTVASAVALLPQLTDRPVSGFPLASRGVAVSWTVPPTATEAGLGVTDTEATDTLEAVTVILAVPLAPPAAAVIVAVPAETPVTRPEDDTLATAPFELVHMNVWYFFGLEVAVSCTVPPTGMVVMDG